MFVKVITNDVAVDRVYSVKKKKKERNKKNAIELRRFAKRKKKSLCTRNIH